MTLRKRTIVIVGAAIFALMAILYVSSRTVLLDSFIRLEEEATRRDVQRALNAVDNQLRELDTTADDWAAWDDTYRFMSTRDPEYVESNLLDDTFLTLRLNALLLVAPSGEVVFGKAFDLQTEEAVPVSPSLLGHLSREGLLSPGGEPASCARGILQLPEGPMLASSRPILTSTDEGPMRGWLIMARYLDSSEVARLADTTDSSLTIHPVDDPEAPADFDVVEPLLTESAQIAVRPLSPQVIAGYAMLEDIYGAPSSILRVDVPREIYSHGQSAVTYLWVSILLVGTVFGGIQLATLDRQVLRRVGQLRAQVARIHSHDDLSARVQVSGQDELSQFGDEVNSMLGRLQHTQADLRMSEERYRELVESADDIIYTHDLEGDLTSANPAALRTYGYTRDEISQLNVADIVNPDFLPLARQKMRDILSHPSETGPYELLTYKKGGEPIWLEVNTRIVRHQSGVPEVQSIGRDITLRRQTQQALRREKERFDILLEEFPLGVAIITGDGDYEYLNAKFVEMFGYT